MDRRSFLRKSTVLASGIAAIAASLAPLRELTDFGSVEEFLQKHYKELTPAEMEKALERIRKEVERQYGVRPHCAISSRWMAWSSSIASTSPAASVAGSACTPAWPRTTSRATRRSNTSACSRCPTAPSTWRKGITVTRPRRCRKKGFFYMPVQCHQCKNPPCVKVCPVDATWQESDGITVIDYDWCIGCRYCEAACPYFARRFNFATPSLPKEQLNPNMAYLGNRPRHKGVMEKCHFCIQRTREGKYPACLEVCPTGARKFGNILDPASEVSYILKNKRVFVLKEEVGTLPRFFYYFDV
jgi:molybdopterin-containing oxidoreductase family iron-sulfur binding subunit